MASILGLFSVLIGAGLVWASSVSLGRMLRPPPVDPIMAAIARDHLADFLCTLVPGLSLVAFGVFATWVRYPRQQTIESPA